MVMVEALRGNRLAVGVCGGPSVIKKVPRKEITGQAAPGPFVESRQGGTGKVLGIVVIETCTLTLVYDHHVPDLSEKHSCYRDTFSVIHATNASPHRSPRLGAERAPGGRADRHPR